MGRAVPRRLAGAVAAVALSMAAGPFGSAQTEESDPFQFLAPSVVLSAPDRADLRRDQVITRVLAGKGGQLAVFSGERPEDSVNERRGIQR